MQDHVISVDDRMAVYDLLGRYVWALDSGDADGFVNLFTPNGSFVDTRGNRHGGPEGLRKAVMGYFNDPDFRGRQHLVTHLFVEGEPGRYTVTSYWTVIKWWFERNEKAVFSTGWSKDTCVKTPAGWKIEERALGWWTDQHCPWVGPPTA